MEKILQTLINNASIGSYLRLICQNHPNVFSEVAKDSDFNAVPDGGCNSLCEYRLSCGHSCTLFCHPFDREHKNITCKKPCTKTCEKEHICPKKCFENCNPCPVITEKLLSRCGHAVYAPCGESELKIRCLEACKKSCKEGHPCSKQCYETCGSCPVIVDKVLPKCKHTVQAACGKSNFSIKCENECNQTCPRNHPCQKKCFQNCGLCEVIIQRTLNSCGHTVLELCGRKENEIKCPLACNRILPCSHQCKNKCYERCQTKCLQLVEIESPVCGHSFKIECCFVRDSLELAKRCLRPCKDILFCGHECRGNCSACKQGKEHIACEEYCQKLLFCGHLCSNKCIEPCVENCKKILQISSPVCGHLLNIECYLEDDLKELSIRCRHSCKKTLPCGHSCKGSCGSCYQGRLHVLCSEACDKTLICGHKCEAKCSASCPPCKKPCRNRCIHKKCIKMCGDPCVTCFKPCRWSCSHKKCSRVCSEVCDRDPCNEKCLKKYPCGHSCVGFCGEPCPKDCFLCNDNIPEENCAIVSSEKNFCYIYLEDCKHTLKLDDLKKWLSSTSSSFHQIKPKTCPKCGTIIRMNSRFNKIIKNCVADLEKVKKLTKYDKNNNLSIQRNLLTKINKSHSNINHVYSAVLKVLSGGRVRDIYELTNLGSIMRMAKEIEMQNYGIYSMFALTPFIEKLVVYMRSCREWMMDFIGKNFLSVSEFQLQQLSVEVYRQSLLSYLLNTAKQNHFVSLSPEFEKCASSLMNFGPLSNENVEYFKKHIKDFVINFNDMPEKISYPQEIVNMSAQWYQCPENHVICFSISNGSFERKDCYKCRNTANELLSISSKSRTTDENYSETFDDYDEVINKNGMSISDDTKSGEFSEKSEINPTNIIMKMGPFAKKSNTVSLQNSSFYKNPSSDPQFARNSRRWNVPECRIKDSHVFRKTTMRSSDEKFSRENVFRRNMNNSDEKTSLENVFRRNTVKSRDNKFFRENIPRRNTVNSDEISSRENGFRRTTVKSTDKKFSRENVFLRNTVQTSDLKPSRENAFGRTAVKSNDEKYSNENVIRNSIAKSRDKNIFKKGASGRRFF